jgi:hypothetical protein
MVEQQSGMVDVIDAAAGELMGRSARRVLQRDEAVRIAERVRDCLHGEGARMDPDAPAGVWE